MRRTLTLLVAVAMATALVATGAAADEKTATLTTSLSGAEEVPAGAGDPDASGFATLTLDRKSRTVCYALSWQDVGNDASDRVTRAHIHEASAGVNGGIVVALFEAQSFDRTGSHSDCVSGPKAVIKDIIRNPTAYYVNVHSMQYPAGAIRGQLGD